MPRVARLAPHHYVYHVLTRGNDRQSVFKGEGDFLRYLEILHKYKLKYIFKLYHYVLMTNHVHLVLEPQDSHGGLSQIMKCVNLSYAQYYKNKYNHIGHFWQDRYKSIIISKDEYLLACGSYVELNPVRARIVVDPKDYKWSSYKAYAYGRSDVVVDEHQIYKRLSADAAQRRVKYREFVRGMLQEKSAMKGEMEGRLLYGGKEFIDTLASRYRVGEKVRQRGRPKRSENTEK